MLKPPVSLPDHEKSTYAKALPGTFIMFHHGSSIFWWTYLRFTWPAAPRRWSETSSSPKPVNGDVWLIQAVAKQFTLAKTIRELDM